MELHMDLLGTQYRAMGFCLEFSLPITRTFCQRCEQFFETQVKVVPETPLKDLPLVAARVLPYKYVGDGYSLALPLFP